MSTSENRQSLNLAKVFRYTVLSGKKESHLACHARLNILSWSLPEAKIESNSTAT